MNIPEYKMDVTVTNKSSNYGNSRVYRFIDSESLTYFRLTQTPFPECCGVAIFSNYSCEPEMTVEEFNKCLSMIFQDMMLNDRFSKVLVYTNVDNRLTRLFCEYPGAVIGEKFRNRRSGNMLTSVEFDIYLPEELKSTQFRDDSNSSLRGILDQINQPSRPSNTREEEAEYANSLTQEAMRWYDSQQVYVEEPTPVAVDPIVIDPQITAAFNSASSNFVTLNRDTWNPYIYPDQFEQSERLNTVKP
jgi:hypothetical protein